MNNDLISRSALKKKIEEVQYTQEFCIEHQIDYSVSMQMLGMVIDNAPTVEIPQGDLISREALKKYKFTTQIANGVELEDIEVVPVASIDNSPSVVNYYTKGFADGERSGRNFPLTDEEKAIIVRQWRPKGEWIDDRQYAEGHSEHAYICKNCGYQIIVNPNMIFEERYCKHCGADMRGGGE